MKNQIGKLLWVTLSILYLACSTQEGDIVSTIEGKEIDTVDFIALGDSYTIGQGVKNTEGWPYQLSKKLEENNVEIGETRIIAQTGWTTNDLLKAIEVSDLNNLRAHRIASLLIGVNNQYQNLSFEIFEAEFNLLITQAIEIAGDAKKVFVISIPDYGVTPFGSNTVTSSEEISQAIDVYNLYMKNRCADLNIPFINITDVSRELGDSASALAPDKLHPSGYQYERWVEIMLPIVLAIVSN